MRHQQLVSGVDEQQRRDLLRICRATDEIVRMTPGFLEDARRTKARIGEHNGKIYRKRPEQWTDADRAVHRRNRSVVSKAAEFARKWNLPFDPQPFQYDPSYLFTKPYEGAIAVEGPEEAVREDLAPLPVVFLSIDIRYPLSPMLKRIDRHLRKRRKEWRATNQGAVYPALKDQVEQLEGLVEVHRHREAGLTIAQTARKMKLSNSSVERRRAKLRAILENASHHTLAPFTHFRFGDERAKSYKGRLSGPVSVPVP